MNDERPHLDSQSVAKVQRAVSGLLRASNKGETPTARYVSFSDGSTERVLDAIDEVLSEAIPKVS